MHYQIQMQRAYAYIHPFYPPYPFPSKSRMDRRSSCHKFDKAAINLYLYHLR